MKVKFNLEKKYVYLIVSLLIIVAGIFAVKAYADSSGVGHDLSQIGPGTFAAGDYLLPGKIQIGETFSTAKILHVFGTGDFEHDLFIDRNLYVGNQIWAVDTTVHQWSDERLKENITTLTDSLDKVLSLRGVSYEWRREKLNEVELPEGKKIGLIAQEVEEVFPELVVTEDKTGYKGVSSEKLIPVLIEAIKEMKNDYETKIEILENEINQLKK